MYQQFHDILIQTRKKFFSLMHGEHLSVFTGNGLEFNEVREYSTDDDIRHINWKITARTRTPSVNLFFDHKRIDISLVYLNSGGLLFENKKDIAIDMLSSLSYLGVFHDDMVSTLFFDTKEKAFFEPSKNKHTTLKNYEFAKVLEPKGCEVDYKKLQENILQKVKQRSVLFFIGDFLEIPDFDILSNLFEIYVLVIRDEKEEKLSLSGEYNCIDTNTLEKNSCSFNQSTINKYNKYMENYDKELSSYFHKQNIYFKKIYTHLDPFVQLREFLEAENGR